MLNIGIFFGGPSREREVSFAGGRTVFDNLNKAVFKPIPIFIDSLGRFIELDWAHIYKGTIRDFYPPSRHNIKSPNFQIYVESLNLVTEAELNQIANEVGTLRELHELKSFIDIAFLCLHGEYGEDGQLQGLLDSMNIPYTGSGIRACSIGIDKVFQKKLMERGDFDVPPTHTIKRQEWLDSDSESIYVQVLKEIGEKFVVRPSHQGSSIGVSILDLSAGFQGFQDAVDAAFFIRRIEAIKWLNLSHDQRHTALTQLTDIRSGLGFPIMINDKWIQDPEDLATELDTYFKLDHQVAILEAYWSEQDVLIEAFINGREFSCIVIQGEDSHAIALPPTEIIKKEEVFDYRSKYLPGLSRKQTPIDLPDDKINAIRKACEDLFVYLDFGTYARIDGFIQEDKIFLNDPNTTSGMLPSSFFFHQAAEIGLNPSQFLTYIIWQSLIVRTKEKNRLRAYDKMINDLSAQLQQLKNQESKRKQIGVILGGYSFERHISVESGRNIFEKLASSKDYQPIPLFLIRTDNELELYQLPINLLLKDNADDIKDKILKFKRHPSVSLIQNECREIIDKFASTNIVFNPVKIAWDKLTEKVDAVFIALHGRPGEDGKIQQILDKYEIPYNGSDSSSSQITIDKYKTLEILREHGFPTANQKIIQKQDYQANEIEILESTLRNFSLPLVVKPVDDGCSSAVMIIKEEKQLIRYLKAIFRDTEELPEINRMELGLSPAEEFPKKDRVLLETLITKGNAQRILEITGGLLTHYEGEELKYELFEPSEALATGEVLTLEEKFLAGEGQNITPARFSEDPDTFRKISEQVKNDLKRAARILNIKGYARIDAFVRIYENNKAETIIIEVNSLPGMTPATCIFHQAAIAGYTPYQFIDQIIQFSFDEQRRKQMAH